MRILQAAIIAGSAIATSASAQDASWDYFEGSVTIDETWENVAGEGLVTTGVQLTDGYDTFTIICRSETEQGVPQPGSLTRWSDSYFEEADGDPNAYLADPRGTPWTKVQWAEACLKTGLLR